MRVSLSGESPEGLHEMVNGVVRAYELERTRVELQSAARTGRARVTSKSEASFPRSPDPNGRLPATFGAGLASLLLVFLLVVWLKAPRSAKA
jgi:hypothetical protein